MKRFLTMLLAVLTVFSLAACSGGNDDNGGNKGEAKDYSLEELVGLICDGVELPYYEAFELTEDNFEQFAFTEWRDGIEAVSADAAIGSVAHSLVLIKTSNGDAAEMAADIASRADVRKWICTDAEAGVVLYTDNYIMLLMSFESNIAPLTENFKTAMGDAKVTELALTGENVPDTPMG